MPANDETSINRRDLLRGLVGCGAAGAVGVSQASEPIKLHEVLDWDHGNAPFGRLWDATGYEFTQKVTKCDLVTGEVTYWTDRFERKITKIFPAPLKFITSEKNQRGAPTPTTIDPHQFSMLRPWSETVKKTYIGGPETKLVYNATTLPASAWIK